MEMSSRVKPFAFDRVFANQPVTGTNNVAEMQLEIEHLELEISRLRNELEQGLNVARAEAFQAGMDQARADRQSALLAATDALQASVESLAGRLVEVEENVAREGAGIALAAASYLAAREVRSLPAKAIGDAIGRALSQVRRGQPIAVRVHPDLTADIDQLIADRQSTDRRRLNLSVIGDESLIPGDAKLCWENGGLVLDANARSMAIAREMNAYFPTE
jgi:flagellar assembly protein FliH